MNRPLAAALVGAVLITQAALASDSFADPGRYQLIPKVLVPNKAGKVREQSVLLDTETGRTWRLAKDTKKGKTDGPRWVPLDKDFVDRLRSEDASLASAKEVLRRGAFEPSTRRTTRSQRLDEFYDENP